MGTRLPQYIHAVATCCLRVCMDATHNEGSSLKMGGVSPMPRLMTELEPPGYLNSLLSY